MKYRYISLLLIILFPILIGCSNNVEDSSSSSSTIKEYYSLSIHKDNDINVSALDNEYKPSSLIVFNVSSDKYDRFDIAIYNSKNETINYIGSNPYSFIMPSDDVDLYITHFNDNVKHRVYQYSSTNGYVSYIDKEYQQNEIVELHVNNNYDSSYELKIYDSYVNEIDFVNKGNNNYSFIMPTRPSYIYLKSNESDSLLSNVITNLNYANISFINHKDIYNKDDEVFFKIIPSISGDININIKDKDNNDVSFQYINNLYSFKMPNEKCYINVDVIPFEKTSLDNEYINNGYNTLIIDHNFNQGFKVRKWENYGDYEFNNNLYIYPSINDPRWTITQWMTDYEINPDDDILYQEDININEHVISAGKYQDTLAKSIYFNSNSGAFSLTSNAQYEYSNCTNEPPGKATRASGYTNNFWVHLLLEQAYFGTELVYIKDYDEMIMDTTFTITKNEKYKDYYSDCAQLEWYLSIQNRNKDADILYEEVNRGEMNKEDFYALYPDYGQYMWIGLYLWDSRYEGQYNNDFSRLEYGSNLYLFVPSTEKTFPYGNHNFPLANEKAHAKYDIRTTIEEQFNIAKQLFYDRGMDYFQHTNFEDLAIGAMNIGLEMPSARNVTASFDSFGFYYK